MVNCNDWHLINTFLYPVNVVTFKMFGHHLVKVTIVTKDVGKVRFKKTFLVIN